MSMASMTDDLDINPFYRCLQSTFCPKFEEAQKNCWIVCIPQSSSVKGVKITGQIIDFHILKPSRYFKSQFVSTDKGESRTVEVEDGKIQVVSGNCNGYSVNILSEELSYNQEFKPFKLYIIDKPLDPVFWNKVQRSDSSEKRKTGEPIVNFKECCSFLWSYISHQETLIELNKKLTMFNQNYVVLPDYLHDAARRLQDIVKWGAMALLSTHNPPLDDLDPLSQEIRSYIESYVLGKVHHKVFPVIRKKFAKEDQELTDHLKVLHQFDLTPDQLGVKEAFCCGLPSAIVELASLNSLVTPCEKLHCLKTCLEHIPEDILNAFKSEENSLKKLNEVSNLTSDDLIPLLVFVLVQARCQFLESNLFYIQNFTWNFSPLDKQSFSFVTFQAAKEFIKTHNFSHLKPSSNKLKKEMSLEELMVVTVELQKQGKNGSRGSDPEGNDSSRIVSNFDRQLERLTRMIEDNTREFRQQEIDCNQDQSRRRSGGSVAARNRNKPTFVDTRQAESPEVMGMEISMGTFGGFGRTMDSNHNSGENFRDFLSTFQQNGFGVSYGKQD